MGRVAASGAFQRARTIALYVALPGEPPSDLLWAEAGERQIVLAAMGPAGPELRSAPALGAAVRTARGFYEPPPGAAVSPDEVDLFVVPGLAFDAARFRLGRGGGYYDRLLARARPDAARIGVVLERWLADALPREPHDVPMTALATEARWL